MVCLFDNLTGVAHGLMHYFDTRMHHHHITFQYLPAVFNPVSDALSRKL